jgi:hypothetical protein
MLRKCVLLRISAACEKRWRRKTLQKGRCNANSSSASDTPSLTAAVHRGVFLAVTRTHPGSVPLQISSKSNAAAEIITLLTIVFAIS